MKEEFLNIGTAVSLLFYALSFISEKSTKEKSKKDELIGKLIKLLEDIFKERANIDIFENGLK